MCRRRGQLDFLALYRTELRLFRESNKLATSLVDDDALKYDGLPTPPKVFAKVMLPFLRLYIEGIEQRFDKFNEVRAGS